MLEMINYVLKVIGVSICTVLIAIVAIIAIPFGVMSAYFGESKFDKATQYVYAFLYGLLIGLCKAFGSFRDKEVNIEA